MNVWLISYSAAGCLTAGQIAAALRAGGHCCRRFARPEDCTGETDAEALSVPPADWAGQGFRAADALVFCCAAGIAVRAVAPHVQSKRTDPAVVVVDERGSFAIPILSGHLGGANALALEIAAAIGAQPAVTTATDLNGVFAVDVFARQNHLYIADMSLAKEISAALLAGRPVGFLSRVPVSGSLPAGLMPPPAPLGICVTAAPGDAPFSRTLRLVPQRYAMGLGCRRGKDVAALEDFARAQLESCGVPLRALRCIASIDLKKDEPGLLELCARWELPLQTASAEALAALPGEFSGSEFVNSVVGVDCVCERAAQWAAGGRLVQKKVGAEGMTFALAEYEEEIRFE